MQRTNVPAGGTPITHQVVNVNNGNQCHNILGNPAGLAVSKVHGR